MHPRSNLTIIASLALSACSIPKGSYKFEAFDAKDKPINLPISLLATGTGVYTAINALCTNYRGAKVVIRDIKTNEELEGESPHQCR